MKRKIFIGLIVFIIIFIAGGMYLILSIDSATRKLHDLVTKPLPIVKTKNGLHLVD
jgi:hypothetical protein